ncbi:MAG: hypothetical protein ACLSB9_26335 [Hydrogeniiclostridium mannosilyticum]
MFGRRPICRFLRNIRSLDASAYANMGASAIVLALIVSFLQNGFAGPDPKI